MVIDMKFYYVVITEVNEKRHANVLTLLDTDNLISKIPNNTIQMYQRKTLKSATQCAMAWNETFNN